MLPLIVIVAFVLSSLVASIVLGVGVGVGVGVTVCVDEGVRVGFDVDAGGVVIVKMVAADIMFCPDTVMVGVPSAKSL